MATITKFEELEIWQTARRLANSIFLLTQKELFSKDFRFRDQIRAASGSVMDNVAESFERSSRLEYVNFLSIAKGSAGEVRSELYRAIDQKYINENEGQILIEEYKTHSSKLAGFIKYLNTSSVAGQKFKDR